MAQLVRHEAHRLINVVEECLEAIAQVVQSRLAVGRMDDAVFGAAGAAALEPAGSILPAAAEHAPLSLWLRWHESWQHESGKHEQGWWWPHATLTPANSL